MSELERIYHRYWLPAAAGLVLTGFAVLYLAGERGRFIIGGEWTIPLWTCLACYSFCGVRSILKNITYYRIVREVEKEGFHVSDRQLRNCIRLAKRKARSTGREESYVRLLLPDILKEDCIRRAINTRTYQMMEKKERMSNHGNAGSGPKQSPDDQKNPGRR